jgi:hypothetical protein
MKGLAKTITDTFENIGDNRGTLRKRIQRLGDRLDDLNRKSRMYARDRKRILADLAEARRDLRALEGFTADEKKSLSAMVQRENTRLLSLAKQRDGVVARLKAAQTALADAIRVRNDYSAQIRDSLRSAAGTVSNSDISVAGLVANDGIVTAGRIAAQLQERVTAIRRFQSDLTALARKGLSSAVIRQITEAGLEAGAATAAALATASVAEIARINSLQGELGASSGATTAGRLEVQLRERLTAMRSSRPT